ncbi:hypothetical protein AVEN_266902-1 [Araneus ventricosus]|uniref:Uncharacterized protein n=1 Tax=Araneus ventricosus TaxID=182803 RepID=A0A4Y2DE15_ARAVE|nr:hypothetical protein AVEN_266902-1 [Araneus ventricosus]
MRERKRYKRNESKNKREKEERRQLVAKDETMTKTHFFFNRMRFAFAGLKLLFDGQTWWKKRWIRLFPSIPVDSKPYGRVEGRGLWTPHQWYDLTCNRPNTDGSSVESSFEPGNPPFRSLTTKPPFSRPQDINKSSRFRPS